MVESWLIEIAKGIGRLFLNPVLYWAVILVFLVGYLRIKRERKSFGFKLFDIFSEWKNTWRVSLLSGLVLSIILVGTGVVFSYETILLLGIVTIVLSLTLRFSLLSASYTVGITYLILLIAPLLLQNLNGTDVSLFSDSNFIGLGFLMVVLLFVEALMLKRSRRNETFPDMTLGRRGVWIGLHHIKKLSIIPFFVVVPAGLITPFASFWPYFSMNGETYSLLLVPFVLGFDHNVKGCLPQKASARIASSVNKLGFIVLLFVIGSIYIGWLSLVGIIIAIIGREFINFRHKTMDNQQTPYFSARERGFKVLGVIPGSPADRLGIMVGETIIKINGKKANDMDGFYYALQDSGAIFKLEVIGDNGEVRFIQSALYEGDHHELGIVSTTQHNQGEQIIANH